MKNNKNAKEVNEQTQSESSGNKKKDRLNAKRSKALNQANLLHGDDY